MNNFCDYDRSQQLERPDDIHDAEQRNWLATIFRYDIADHQRLDDTQLINKVDGGRRLWQH